MKDIVNHQKIFVKQAFELAEIFSFETRNKYRICDETGQDIAFAAEQQKGLFGFLWRQFLGHWRSFDIHFFDLNRQEFLIARHPFRWFFQRLEVSEFKGRSIGIIERKFSILTKKFDVLSPNGNVLLTVSSPLWRIWTFPFMRNDQEMAQISKKWTGIGYEFFTDKDTFLVDFTHPTLTSDEKILILAASIFVDLMFFENKGGNSLLDIVD